LKFSRLVAETGVDETAVRQVLDRFRADDCSFLTPPPLDLKVIGNTTRIDVGHEALLRRWEKVSGRGAELGWLRAEQQAGERYRALLAMAEGENAELPAHLVDERLAWWRARPRTEEWAERYGGDFASVQRLLRRSQRQQTFRWWRNAAAFAVVGATALAMFLLWQSAVVAKNETEKNRIETLRTTKKSLERLSGFLDDGTLRAAGAKKFLEDANETLAQLLKDGESSPEISEIWISMLLAVSDTNENLGDYRAATEFAVNAETLSESLVKKYPNQPSLKHKIYASKFRVADQLAKNRANVAKAEEKYRVAFETIKQLASDDPDNLEYQREIVFAGNKLGDIQQFGNNWQGALDWYNAGLTIIENVGKKSPSAGVTREIATQKGRIAQILSQRGQPGDDQAALAQYREVLAIQEQLLKDDSDNATLLSNAALTYRRIAGLLKDKPDETLLQYEKAVAYRKRLYAGDPGNMTWGTGLVRDYTSLGDVLMQGKKWRDASQIYNEAIRIAEGITLRNPADTAWQKRLAELNAKRGDAARYRGGEAKDQRKIDESVRFIDDALARYRTAAKDFEKLANDPKAGTVQYRELFDVRISIGDILAEQNKHSEALEAYQSASATAERATTARNIVDWQIKLSAALERAGDGLTNPPTCCQPASREGALAYYRKALATLETAAVKAPDNQDVQSRMAALGKKIEIQRSAQ
jgi:hypothetical protein